MMRGDTTPLVEGTKEQAVPSDTSFRESFESLSGNGGSASLYLRDSSCNFARNARRHDDIVTFRRGVLPISIKHVTPMLALSAIYLYYNLDELLSFNLSPNVLHYFIHMRHQPDL